ncbi:MAG: CAP domain-containing protein [Bacteroidota bacterium]
MYRVFVAPCLLLALSGCSLSSGMLTSGFAGAEPQETASVSSPARQTFGSLGGEPSTRASKASETKVASLDKAPEGSFGKAPHGALSDRDYSATKLDPEKARDLINRYRKEKGLKPLKLNAELSNAAKAHSRDLAKWDRISHFGSDGSNPWDRIKRVGYNARLAAENVGTGQASIEEVIKGWKESPGHNKNLLLSDAEHMGIALVQDPKTEFKTFWTLVIGAPL